MNPDQLQTAVRHLKGLLKALDNQDKAEIQLEEQIVYYDSRGNVVEIKIVSGLDFIEEIL